ncbi:MAG TPA: SDR family oxidoreductase [Rectinema sp.]|jgi:NAD(P)-dependent dehydrogenase (short-subunit alcohol dehydrogenase family)|nr:SDR family oxidoreductase [Rectinema sp.]HOE99575.1 SDR family oxidoreductase [Rectinema sp.]HOM92900.1 SDR family oxidoreductase [Rectinema sp.]HOR49154.1 SDR family oxidoreductase [Rectinema sp.]HOU07107.1 SDR family oxidoreductase [Rectinema sp.]
MEEYTKYYENKVAVVTGAASGIGLALCELLLEYGARTIVMADLNGEKLKAESQRLELAYPKKVLAIQTDVSQKESVEAMIAEAARFGGGQIHFLFNNAGLGLWKRFDDTTDKDWNFAFDVNFFSAFHGIRAVLPIMRAQGGGHIANTASGAVYSPMAEQSMYCATKSALLGLTGALRYELWDENIRFSTVIPGSVATSIWDNVGGPPASAISPRESAKGILKGLAANERVVIVTEADRDAARNTYRPEIAQHTDEYFLGVARQRREGKLGL